MSVPISIVGGFCQQRLKILIILLILWGIAAATIHMMARTKQSTSARGVVTKGGKAPPTHLAVPKSAPAKSLKGSGRIEWENGDVYEGEIMDGVVKGKGKCTYQNGDKYDGDWADGKPHGKGEMKYATGRRYVGHWVKGKRQGTGSMECTNTGETYKGEWKDDKFNGASM